MAKQKANSPLLGYNTNVRHKGELFHIQTEDSGIEHPHVITHLFTDGTILATKKTSYAHLVGAVDMEDKVRALMKDQHKSMFVELRDGVHDAAIAAVLGDAFRDEEGPRDTVPTPPPVETPKSPTVAETPSRPSGVRVIRPAVLGQAPKKASPETVPREARGRSIFSTPDMGGDFGNDLISDKSLDEVILSYIKEELEES